MWIINSVCYDGLWRQNNPERSRHNNTAIDYFWDIIASTLACCFVSAMVFECFRLDVRNYIDCSDDICVIVFHLWCLVQEKQDEVSEKEKAALDDTPFEVLEHDFQEVSAIQLKWPSIYWCCTKKLVYELLCTFTEVIAKLKQGYHFFGPPCRQ